MSAVAESLVLFGGAPAPIVLRLPFTSPPVDANEARNGRANYHAQNRDKRTVAEAVVAVVRQARVPHLDRVMVHLVWHAPDYHVRDADGLGPMLKAVQDALTPPKDAILKGTPTAKGTPRKFTQRAKLGAGIIADDRASIVPTSATTIELGSDDPRIELHLYPLPPLPPRPPTPRRRTR